MAYLGMIGAGLPSDIKICEIVRQDEIRLDLDIGVAVSTIPGFLLLFGPIKGITPKTINRMIKCTD